MYASIEDHRIADVDGRWILQNNAMVSKRYLPIGIVIWFCVYTIWIDASYVESFLFLGTTNGMDIPSHRRLYQQSSASSSSSVSPSSSASKIDLSRSFRSILARNRNHNHRQRFVTGKFPLIVSVEENPNRKWLDLGRNQQTKFSNLVVLLNGTNIDRSLASYDRYQWLDDSERQILHDRYDTVSMELLAEINIDKPGYLQILSSDDAGSSAALSRNMQQRNNVNGDGDANWFWNRRRGDTNQNKEQINQEIYSDEVEELSLRDRLWSTGFSLTSPRGVIRSVDIRDGHIGMVNGRSESMISWPNEVTSIPHPLHEYTRDALLVADGFLVPGKDRGGIYVVNNPGHEESEWSIPLTDTSTIDRWFYHKAVWVDLTGDGRQSILTARAKLSKVVPPKNGDDNLRSSSVYGSTADVLELGLPKNGQLIWLEMPKAYRVDEKSGTKLENDGTVFNPLNARHLPWKERVLMTGPDVAFAVADMDPNDDTIEILASQFFDEKVTLHSILRGPSPRVTFSRVIDDESGAAFGGVLVNLDPTQKNKDHRVVDSGSTIKSCCGGNSFSHFLVTSHEASNKRYDGKSNANNVMMTNYKEYYDGKQSSGHISGGSLFAYKVPIGKNAWKTEPWVRTTIATGFQAKQQVWNVINPGAPGFPYVFYAHIDDESKGKRPMIAVAGDCAESCYIFRPERLDASDTKMDVQAKYNLMCEIKCGATVGSLAVGYDDFCSTEQEYGYAKVYIPCFENDKILVFALGRGEEDTIDIGDRE